MRKRSTKDLIFEYDREEPQIRPAGEHRYHVNGRVPIDDLNELLDANLPHEEWDTVGGLIYGLLGHVPTAGERVVFDGFAFTVEAVQGRRIANVLVELGVDEPGGHEVAEQGVE